MYANKVPFTYSIKIFNTTLTKQPSPESLKKNG